jgi:hypothetical protein
MKNGEEKTRGYDRPRARITPIPIHPLDPPHADAAALVAERANQTILPLERSSLLHAVSRIVSIIKQEVGARVSL